MANSIEFAKNYTGILDEVYQRAAVSRCLNSGGRMVRAGRNAKEILIPKISVTGLGDYTRNVGYKTGSITYEYETHSFGYDRAIRLFADIIDVEESGVLDCFVEAGAELQRTQVAPEGDAYTFSQIASTEGVTMKGEDLSEASAVDVLAALRAVTNDMDEKQVFTGSRYLFITPTLRGVLDDFSWRTRRAPTACWNASTASWRCRRRASTRQSTFSPATTTSSATRRRRAPTRRRPTPRSTPQRPTTPRAAACTRPWSPPTKSGLTNYYELKGAGADINFMVVEKSAVIKYDKHVASHVFSPDELEALDSYMLKYRKYGIVSVLENKLDGVYVSVSTE